MSARKGKLVARPATPKSNIKSNTPRLNTLKSSTPKTEPKLPSKTVKNLNPRENISGSSVLNTTVITDPTHTQKYMQHKLDMAYNKYLQALALHSWLLKTHQEAETSIDEQLVHHEEMHESALEEEQTKKELLNEMSVVFETENKFKCLEKSLQEVTQFIAEKNLIDKIKKLNSNLHYFCDKLMFENIKFVNTEENYNTLQNTLEEISSTLDEIKPGDNEEFLILVEHIFKIKVLLKTIRKNQKVVKNYQYEINNLTLRAASMELSKLHDENTLKK